MQAQSLSLSFFPHVWHVYIGDFFFSERIEEIKKLMAEVKAMYLKNKEELELVESGRADDRLNEFTLQIQE